MSNTTTNEKVLQRRDRRIPFLGGIGTDGTYKRMQHFTEFSKSANVKEYSRKYIDESAERTDSTGMSPEISYAFDLYSNDPVQKEMADIADKEIVGTDAIKPLLIVHLDEEVTGGGYKAYKRNYSIIPDSDGSDDSTYTFSGTLKSAGVQEEVVATLSDDGLTATVQTGDGE